ncbi:hypothetical protein [Tepidibacter aestuarii]|uniref:hypothetical protein n=1 Tax=Tepidibacter aestuarii TaxID=2925782 RepID=UPI0020BDCEF7|nr:hypothetical protein [Tepidibacter aestuarii]CAH2214154.1 conserved protein of unknown function [Tepidibacter aestuarii]
MDERKDFNDELEELKEWQDNQYNPGHYIGTGRVKKPLTGLNKYPLFLIIWGIFMLLPFIYTLFKNGFKIESIQFIIASIVPIGLIIGGIQRLKNK